MPRNLLFKVSLCFNNFSSVSANKGIEPGLSTSRRLFTATRLDCVIDKDSAPNEDME